MESGDGRARYRSRRVPQDETKTSATEERRGSPHGRGRGDQPFDERSGVALDLTAGVLREDLVPAECISPTGPPPL